LNLLLRVEVINWADLVKTYGHHFEHLDEFKDERATILWDELKNRVIEHNIRVVAKYYKTITLKRLSSLLSLDDSDTEKQLCKQVTNKSIYAKINRPEGVVSFKKTKTPEQKLNDWSNDIKTLLSHVEKATHYIQRENMIHRIDTGED